MASIILPQALWSVMLAAVAAGYPEEVCGLIGGKDGRVESLFPIENIRHSSVVYEMNPGEQIRAMLAMEAAGLEMTAIYHSHPSGPPHPSAMDIDLAYYPDTAQIIISLLNPQRPEVRAFEIRDGLVSEIELIIAPD